MQVACFASFSPESTLQVSCDWSDGETLLGVNFHARGAIYASAVSNFLSFQRFFYFKSIHGQYFSDFFRNV